MGWSRLLWIHLGKVRWDEGALNSSQSSTLICQEREKESMLWTAWEKRRMFEIHSSPRKNTLTCRSCTDEFDLQPPSSTSVVASTQSSELFRQSSFYFFESRLPLTCWSTVHLLHWKKRSSREGLPCDTPSISLDDHWPSMPLSFLVQIHRSDHQCFSTATRSNEVWTDASADPHVRRRRRHSNTIVQEQA